MRIHRNIIAIIIATILQNLVFAYVIERIFWESRSMSVQDVVFTEFIYVGIILLLEIPAGVLADRGSRRTVLIAASVLQVLEFIFVLFATRFLHFAAAVAVAAVSEVLVSGTRNALIWESLAETGDTAGYTRILGRLEAIDSASFVGVLLAGGFLAERLGMPPLYWIAIAANTLAIAAHLFLVDAARRDADGSPVSHGSEIRLGLRLILGNEQLLAALIAGIAVGGSITYMDEFLTLHLRDLSMPVWSFGLVMGGAYTARAAGALAGEQLEKPSGRRHFFAIAVGGFLAAQALFGISGAVMGLGLIVLLYFTWGVLDVLAISRLHQAAESGYRATAESVASQIEQVVALAFGLLFSAAAKRLSIASAVSVTALAAAALYFGYMTIRRLLVR